MGARAVDGSPDGRMSRRARRRVALVAVALLAGAAVLYVASVLFLGTPLRVDWYRVDAPTLLTVEVTTGAIAWPRVADVSETPERVVVTVRSFDLALGPQTAAGYPRLLAVHLGEPLGARLVYDGTGHEVPLYRPPEAAPSPSP